MIKLELLGRPSVISLTKSELPLTKPAYLLIYLACRADWVSRDELAFFFRPDADEKTARHNFRLLLTRARKFDWAAGLEQEGKRLRFNPESDLALFREALGKADWQNASKLYKGKFLKDAPDLGLATFEAWLGVERASLASAWQDAAQKYAKQLSEQNQAKEAANLLARILKEDSLTEDVIQAYLRNSYLAGDANKALEAYKRFKLELKQDLDLEPLEETQALAATIERSENLSIEAVHAKIEVPLVVSRPPIMIGRDKELRLLKNDLTQIAIISGEAGIGKSRLITELNPNALWLRCREGLNHVPYFPIIEAIRSLSDLSNMGSYKADLARLMPELQSDVTNQESEEVAKSRLLEGLATVLEAENKTLVFDDLQWADAASLEFFVFLAHRHKAKLYASVRKRERSAELNERIASLRSQAGFKELELSPLSRTDVMNLLRSLSPETGEAQAFSTWLSERSGGNPFFFLETLRALFEAQVLKEAKTGWYSSVDSVTKAYAELAIPAGVAALVERRVNVLSDVAKRVLEVALVLAEGIQAESIAKLSGLSLWAASDALSELEEQGLVNDERFSHDLARQALYDALPKAKRRFLHKQIAETLTDKQDELIRAEHYYRAGDLAKAAELWFLVAGTRFSLGHFTEEATALFERIISLDIDTPDLYRAQARLAGIYRSQNRQEETEQLIDSVLKYSKDTYARTFALLQQTIGYFLKGEISKAEKSLEAAEEQVTDYDVPALQRDVQNARVQLDYFQGRFEAALALCEKVLAEKRQEPKEHGFVNWLSTTALIYCSVGRFEEALECYYEAYEIAKELNFTRNQAQTASDIMATLYDLGRIQEGLSLGEEALKLGDFDVTPPLRYHLALAYFEQKEQAKVFEQCDQIFKGDSSINIQSHSYALLAEAYAWQKDELNSYQAMTDGLNLIDNIDHNDAKAIMTIAVLKFGTQKHVDRVKTYVEQLSKVNLPAYLKTDFEEAVALQRHI